MSIVLLSGSFHKYSKSLAILRAVESMLSPSKVILPQLDALPFYSDDLTGNHQPVVVDEFMAQIEAADAIICCTPEYNHSVPAVLKNAIDWASRPAFQSPLKDKPICIITQANSAVGGARAQAHLKLIFDATLSRVHLAHEMMISDIDNKINAEHELTDAKVKDRLQKHLTDFKKFRESFHIA